jgi:hypothetical protein
MNLIHNGIAEPWGADTAIEEIRVLLPGDPTSPVVIHGAYLFATRGGSVTMVRFTRTLVVIVFPAPRRVGDSDKYKEQRNLREFELHTAVW